MPIGKTIYAKCRHLWWRIIRRLRYGRTIAVLEAPEDVDRFFEEIRREAEIEKECTERRAGKLSKWKRSRKN